MKSLTKSMCWDLVTIKKDRLNGIGAAFFRKPLSNECYTERRHQNPPMCEENDDPNAAWYKVLTFTINSKAKNLSCFFNQKHFFLSSKSFLTAANYPMGVFILCD